ncbi:unnamed protein product [Arctogadus glacialis]
MTNKVQRTNKGKKEGNSYTWEEINGGVSCREEDGQGHRSIRGVWRRDSRACGLKAGWTSREAQVDDPGTGPGRSRRSQGEGLDTGHWTRKEQETGESA